MDGARSVGRGTEDGRLRRLSQLPFCVPRPSSRAPFAGGHHKGTGVFVGVKSSLHLGEVVKEADKVDCPESFARFHFHATDFLNEADITPLMAPRFVNNRRMQRHARQPNAVAQLIGADEPLRHFAVFPPITSNGRRAENRQRTRLTG